MPTPQNLARNDTPTAFQFPVRLLVVASLLTIMAFAWFGLIAFETRRDAKMCLARLSRIEQLQGSILHLNELLTASARMAVATGDLQWEKRYGLYESQLAAAIKETTILASAPSAVKSTTMTEAAKLKLVDTEKRAFRLVAQGRAAESNAILFSAEYVEQKRIYGSGITFLMRGLGDDLETQMDARRASVLQPISLGGAVGGGLMLVAWAMAVGNFRRLRRTSARTAPAVRCTGMHPA